MIGTWARTTFSALADSHYRTLWAGTTLSFLAFAMSSVVQGVVAYDITHKNGSVGNVALGMGLATILTAPFGGVIADRVSKRKLLLIGQLLIAANFTAVGLLITTGHITISMLVASTFMLGLVFSFIAPARQAWIGELLKGPRLANGIALQQVAMTSTRIFGPFLAGLLVAIGFVGAGGTYIAMGAIIGVVVITLAQLPASPGRERAGRPSAMADFKGGLQHLAERPRLALLAASFIGVVIAGYSYQVILPGLLSEELGRSSNDIAWLLGIAGFSGLVATIAVAGLADSKYAWRLQLAGGVMLGIALVVLGASSSYAQALIVMLFVGGGSSVFQMLNSALVLQESDPAYYGRVMSLTMLAWGFNGIAGWPFGLLADGIGEKPTLVVMGLLVLGVVAATGVARAILQAGGRPGRAAARVATTLGPAGSPD
ncbi:MAG: MFS transporter [Dehalococcoidia bacterium]